jgi:hypothetical protein
MNSDVRSVAILTELATRTISQRYQLEFLVDMSLAAIVLLYGWQIMLPVHFVVDIALNFHTVSSRKQLVASYSSSTQVSCVFSEYAYISQSETLQVVYYLTGKDGNSLIIIYPDAAGTIVLTLLGTPTIMQLKSYHFILILA